MRIAIDATPLLLRSSGVKNYVYYWLRSLQELAGPRTVSAFPFLEVPRELNHEGSARGVVQSWMRLGLVIGSNYAPFPLLDLVTRGIDIFHMSNILVRNPPRRCLRTATLHDMTCWVMPEFHTAANVKAAKDFAARVAGPADGLIAVSEWTRSDAVRILKLRPEQIQVIPSGGGRGILRGGAGDGGGGPFAAPPGPSIRALCRHDRAAQESGYAAGCLAGLAGVATGGIRADPRGARRLGANRGGRARGRNGGRPLYSLRARSGPAGDHGGGERIRLSFPFTRASVFRWRRRWRREYRC